MSKHCIIYNMAAKYRAPIFQLMDRELDIDWYYGKQIGNIQEMDPTLLKNMTRLKRTELFGPLTWQHGVVGLLRNAEYQDYLMLGDLFSLSTWAILLLKPIVARKKKVYFWSHGWYGREGFLKKWLKRIFFGLADATMLYSNYAREMAIRQGNKPEKLKVIHNSLNYSEQVTLRETLKPSNIYYRHFDNSYPNLIFIGRLTPIKKLDMLIEAVCRLKQQNIKVNLTIIGDGSEAVKLKKLANEKMINDNVWFYGECYDDTQNAALIYNADLCVAPGNVGLTAMHTMIFGTPVLTHGDFTLQMPEFEAIRPGETGAFFKYGSIESMSNAIRSWLEEKSSCRNEVREACIKEIESSWNPEFQIKIIKEILK